VSAVHDFTERLAYSHSQSDQSWWDEVYRQAFPDMVGSVDLRANGWHQTAGRDRAITLGTGRTLYVDEKVRQESYADILLEVWSVYPKGRGAPYPEVPGAKPGWVAKTQDCDYLAYAVEPLRVCYLLPYFSLRAVWAQHGARLRSYAETRRNGYRWVTAPNRGYQTISIALPLDDLYQYMSEAMTVRWGTA
jgi:hypothetical protein